MKSLSFRLPNDLQQWLEKTPMENAATLSDKLRIAVSKAKHLHDGGTDYSNALSLHRDLSRLTREEVMHHEKNGNHSEVMAVILEHIPLLGAALQASEAKESAQAVELEAQMVRRIFQLTETLLRQAVTTGASAFDPLVIRKNSDRLVELSCTITLLHAHLDKSA